MMDLDTYEAELREEIEDLRYLTHDARERAERTELAYDLDNWWGLFELYTERLADLHQLEIKRGLWVPETNPEAPMPKPWAEGLELTLGRGITESPTPWKGEAPTIPLTRVGTHDRLVMKRRAG